ncbi:MAG: FtsX-like permease family protein, partial [Oscillospiraceae bacterium]
ALITILQGVINNVNQQFESVGANTVIIQAAGTPLKRGLTEKDLQEINKIDGIVGFAPTVSATIDIPINGKIEEDVTLEGKNEVYFRRNSELVKEGRPINILDIESKNNVCLISRKMERKLFMDQSALNKEISIGGIRYRVIGITDDGGKLNSVMATMAGNSDSIMLPYKNVMQISDTKNVMALEIYMDADTNTDALVDNVKQYLNSAFNYKDDSYTVIEMDSLLDMMKTMQGMMQAMLVGIASIALLVGGIGIMNMMLVSVTERTTEIGLRKALGAEPKRIQIQFLTEAVLLSLFGGLIGLVLGLSISVVAAIAIGFDFVLSWSAIILGVGFSAAIGIIFGFAPAKKASELNPIDALRSV